MKRDMDIIRKIILATRNSETPHPLSGVEGISNDDFAQHVQLLEEADLVKAAINGGDSRPAFAAVIYRLTWSGHDFADAIAEDSVWQKAKENVLKPTASWTFGILLDYLKVEISSRIPGLDRLL